LKPAPGTPTVLAFKIEIIGTNFGAHGYNVVGNDLLWKLSSITCPHSAGLGQELQSESYCHARSRILFRRFSEALLASAECFKQLVGPARHALFRTSEKVWPQEFTFWITTAPTKTKITHISRSRSLPLGRTKAIRSAYNRFAYHPGAEGAECRHVYL